ncbi:MAG: dimethylarginine dimethylaminohydrolase family protein [Steroidobacteraceae bacterium]
MMTRVGGKLRAFVRAPGAALNRCELTHLPRVPIDVERARCQHAAYVNALAELGATIEWLAPLEDQPDAVFVEDTAVIYPEIIIMAWPGVASRQAEVAFADRALAQYREVHAVRPPGLLDGGDVLTIGQRVLVGLSTRTNQAGFEQLREALAPFGYSVDSVRVRGCLHLKSACTAIDAHRVIANLNFIERAALGAVTIIEVDPREPRSANTLTVQGTTLFSAAYPRTGERLHAAGLRTRAIDVAELEKAESGLTCMSLLLEES